MSRLLFSISVIFLCGICHAGSETKPSENNRAGKSRKSKDGYVTYQEKVGKASFKRQRNGSSVASATIHDANGLSQRIYHLNEVSASLKNGSYGSGQRSTHRQLRRVRRGIDAEVMYEAEIRNARIGDMLIVNVGGQDLDTIISTTVGHFKTNLYLTSMGKEMGEAKILSNKGSDYYFELDDVVGMVKEGVNDCIGFRFFPAPNNNANYPGEVLRFKLKRIEKLKVVYSSSGKKFRKRPKQRN